MQINSGYANSANSMGLVAARHRRSLCLAHQGANDPKPARVAEQTTKDVLHLRRESMHLTRRKRPMLQT